MAECENYELMIGAAVDGELSETEAAALRAHLETCENCRAYYTALREISGAIRSELSAPPAGLTERIMASVRAEAGETKEKKTAQIIPFRRYVRPLSLAAAAALVLWAGVRVSHMRMGSASSSAAPAAGAMVTMSQAAAEEPQAPQAAEPMEEEAAAAPAEFDMMLETKAAASSAADGGEAYFSITRSDTGETLYAGADEELLRLLTTPDQPEPIPDRESDFTLALDGSRSGEIWELWEEDGVILCRRSGESEGGAAMSTESFRERLELPEE